MTPAQREWLDFVLTHLDVTHLHHGDCLGADAQAHEIAVGYTIEVVIHPPTNDKLRAYCGLGDGDNVVWMTAKPYLFRNRAIVNACDMLFAAPDCSKGTDMGGTWATIRYATNKGVPTVVAQS
jgi:hypothetical protein